MEHEPPAKVRFDSVGQHRKIEDPGKRIKAMVNAEDRAGQFLWHLHAFYLTYAARRLGEIADDIVSIDNANKWGFNHELGPFEIWDALGVQQTIPRMEQDGYAVPDWVQEMIKTGHPTFYQRDDHGVVIGDLRSESLRLCAAQGGSKRHRDQRSAGRRQNRRAAGGRVPARYGRWCRRCWNSTARPTLSTTILSRWAGGRWNACKSDFDGLVVGNQGEHFSAGREYLPDRDAGPTGPVRPDRRDHARAQDLFQAMRYAPRPVVTAPFGMALGGGAEFTMAGARTVAHAELYIGLVEDRRGPAPGGNGLQGNAAPRDQPGDADSERRCAAASAKSV